MEHPGPVARGGGCTGHAFEHSTGIGEALARTVVGEPLLSDLGSTDVDRHL